MQRWKRRPEGSNWGDFGPDDQIGRLNLITPERRRAAATEVREGIAFPLSLPLDYPRGTMVTDARHPPLLAQTMLYDATATPHSCDVFCDDKVELCLQFSTQWDALSHVGALFDADDDGKAEKVYYNGYRGGEDIVADKGDGRPKAGALGIENMAETCVQGRGVMVNLHSLFGNEQVHVDLDALMGAMKDQGATIEPGDMLCLYTGLSATILDRGDDLTQDELFKSCPVLDGRDERLLDWIDDAGIAAIVSDNIAVEAMTLDGPGEVLLPLHHRCLFKLGIPLGELWYLRELAEWLRAHDRTRFLMTAPPLRLPGAVGSPVSGVATV